MTIDYLSLGDHFVRSIIENPELAYHDTNLSRLSIYDWVRILKQRPELVDLHPTSWLEAHEWQYLLKHQPSLIDKCPKKYFAVINWANVIEYQRDIADHPVVAIYLL